MSVLGTLAPRSFFFIGAATPELYTLSLHDALPISSRRPAGTLRTLCLSSGRRGRNEKRRSKRHTVGPWVIAGQERHDQAGHYFAWRAPGCVASRLCCRPPR